MSKPITYSSLVLAALTTATMVVCGPADASSYYYPNCTALAKTFHHGVAKSRAAALVQVRNGYGMPAYGTRARHVYATNHTRLDRDKDGTACER